MRHGPYFVNRKSDGYGMGTAPAPIIFSHKHHTK